MRRVMGFVSFFALLGPLSGCGSPAEVACKDVIAATNGVVSALEQREPAEKVRAATLKLKAANERMDAVTPTADEEERLRKQYFGELKAATDRMKKAASAYPEGGLVLVEVLLGETVPEELKPKRK